MPLLNVYMFALSNSFFYFIHFLSSRYVKANVSDTASRIFYIVFKAFVHFAVPAFLPLAVCITVLHDTAVGAPVSSAISSVTIVIRRSIV